ncbi:MAG: protein phosphatase 2C domain-containing protein [Planctomycetota bacterium]
MQRSGNKRVESGNVTSRPLIADVPELICETCKGRIHEENQDRVVARCPSENFPFSLIAVADGISSCAFGGSVARWVVEQHLSTDEISLPPDVDIETVFRNYLTTLNEQFRAEFADLPEMLESGACLSMAVNRANETHCFWVGDGPIYETKQQNGRYVTLQQLSPQAKMIKVDLEAAGIPYQDADGLYADFHALRHSFITGAWESGESPEVVMSLARHRSLRMTMQYTHVDNLVQTRAVQALRSP